MHLYFHLLIFLLLGGCATGNAPQILSKSPDNKKVVVVNALDEKYVVQQIGANLKSSRYETITPNWKISDVLNESVVNLNKISRFNIITSKLGSIGQLRFSEFSGLSGGYDLTNNEKTLKTIVKDEKPDFLLIVTAAKKYVANTNNYFNQNYEGIGYLRRDAPGVVSDFAVNQVVIHAILVDPTTLNKFGRALAFETSEASFKQFPQKDYIVAESEMDFKPSAVEKMMNNGPSPYQKPIEFEPIKIEDVDSNKEEIQKLMHKAIIDVGKQIKLIPKD